MKREETVDYHIKAAWHAIARMYNHQASKYDGTMSMGFVLLNIHSEEGIPATKIAPMIGLEARSLTRLLKSMEEKGIIYREPDPNDRRSIRVYLTKEGQKRKERARETVLAFNTAVRNSISKQKLDVFFNVIQDLIKMIEKNNIYETVNI